MAKVNFFTRTITKDKNALVPIYVRVRAGKQIDVVCKADILVKPENWSNETQQVRQRADLHKFKSAGIEEAGKQNLNDKIAGLRATIENEIEHPSDLIAKLKEKDPENRKARNEELSRWLISVIDKYWHPEKYEENLFSFIQDFIDKSETRINRKTGRPVCYKMRREYEVTFQYLKDYATEKKKKIDFKDIDLCFYDAFTAYLQEKKLAVNTIGKKVQTLKIFLNAAREENKNHYDMFKSKRFTAVSEEAETIYLNETELQALYDLDLSKDPSAEKVRDLFLVASWTGCRFGDLAQITPESISNGYISIRQYKTGAKVLIPLHPVVTTILNRYKGVLPKAISNQKFNVALKDIAEDAKIKDITTKSITKGGVRETAMKEKHRFVTTHTARRSFSTNLYKSGFPTLSIMAVTGHKTEKAFLKYIKVTPDEHARKLQEHWNKPILKAV